MTDTAASGSITTSTFSPSWRPSRATRFCLSRSTFTATESSVDTIVATIAAGAARIVDTTVTSTGAVMQGSATARATIIDRGTAHTEAIDTIESSDGIDATTSDTSTTESIDGIVTDPRPR